MVGHEVEDMSDTQIKKLWDRLLTNRRAHGYGENLRDAYHKFCKEINLISVSYENVKGIISSTFLKDGFTFRHVIDMYLGFGEEGFFNLFDPSFRKDHAIGYGRDEVNPLELFQVFFEMEGDKEHDSHNDLYNSINAGIVSRAREDLSLGEFLRAYRDFQGRDTQKKFSVISSLALKGLFEEKQPSGRLLSPREALQLSLPFLEKILELLNEVPTLGDDSAASGDPQALFTSIFVQAHTQFIQKGATPAQRATRTALADKVIAAIQACMPCPIVPSAAVPSALPQLAFGAGYFAGAGGGPSAVEASADGGGSSAGPMGPR